VIHDGQIVLFAFPQTDQTAGKLRPALVLRRVPGPHDDWLVCMISSQLGCEVPGVDEVLRHTDHDFRATGLKLNSVIRTTRLAVVAAAGLQGAIGDLSDDRLTRIRARLADWIRGAQAETPLTR
jgi:mRNA interferase MazF